MFLVCYEAQRWATLVGKIERELETGDEVADRRREGRICRFAARADLERNVVQGPLGKGFCVEDFIPAERTADEAVDLGLTSTSRRARHFAGTALTPDSQDRLPWLRLEQRSTEEVGAVCPGVEMGERINALCRCSVDGAIRPV